MKVLIDMNLSPRWAAALGQEGFKAQHWSDVGTGTETDAEIMRFAKVHDFIVLTHDLDFGSILAATQGKKPSVVQIRAGDVNPDAIGGFVAEALRRMSAELRAGALLTLYPNRARLRLLPLLQMD
jgi:predicted nuclease of predicted toxin-antitoxin system